MQLINVVKIILINSENKILLLKRGVQDIRRPNQWDIPGGHVEDGETLEQALIRECHEETGIKPGAIGLLHVQSAVFETDDKFVNWAFFYGRTDSENVILSHEHSDHKWVSLESAARMIQYERQQLTLNAIKQNKLIPGLA